MKLPTELTLSQIAHIIGGRVHGTPDLKVGSFAISPLAAKEGDIALVFEPALLKVLDQCKASAVIVPEGTQADRPMILVERPTLAIQRILTAVQPKRHAPEKGVHSTAVVDPTAELGEGVAIGAHVVIGPRTKLGAKTKVLPGTYIGADVTIGEDVHISSNCSILDGIKIGNRVILHPGVCLGSDGYGYVTEKVNNMERRIQGIRELSDEANPHLKIPQIGGIVIGDDVEIGANTTVDRATMGATTIGNGTKIDNLVMIAHNCTIGKDVLIIAGTMVAGSCTIGDRAILAGGVGLKDHLKIGKDAILEGRAGAMRDVPEGDVQSGVPCVPHTDHMKQIAAVRRLPQMMSDFKTLQKRVAQLEQQLLERQLSK